jgi:VIT1/CCC1 family predicted Fe2+/Mn2+ transporter
MTQISRDERMRRDSELIAKRALQIHRGAARAAVLGVNDGLVSVLCIVLAVAAAQNSAKAVLIAGFAGLVAGAISMAAGEWISIKSQIDLFKGVLDDLTRLVREDRELLTSQLQADFERSGLDKHTASVAASEIARDDGHLQEEYARNVMGINPKELGSPWTAALSSFTLFMIGGLAALSPWFFSEGHAAEVQSIIFTVIGGLVVGGYVSYTGGDRMANGALRQLFIIIFASVVTYGVGHLFGVAVGS